MRNVLRHARLLMVGLLIALPHFVRAEVSAEQGKQLFKANCARCHYVTDKRFVGPGLAGVQDRWSDEANLLAWIRNSSDYLKTGDSYATKLFADYNGSVMPAFQLQDDEIRSILAYIAEPGDEAKPATAETDGAAPADGGKTDDLCADWSSSCFIDSCPFPEQRFKSFGKCAPRKSRRRTHSGRIH